MAAEPAPAPAPPPAPHRAAQAATPPLATEAMPASSLAREEKLPSIDVGAWVRGGRPQLQKGRGCCPRAYRPAGWILRTSESTRAARFTRTSGVTLNLTTRNGLGGTAGIEDAIIGFDFADPIHLWIGQLLVPVDRATTSPGPLFHDSLELPRGGFRPRPALWPFPSEGPCWT